MPTNYHGIYFSPDGSYYITNSSIEEPIILYHKKTNNEIWNSRKSEISGLNHLLSWYIFDSQLFLYLESWRGVAKINCKKGHIVEFSKKSNKDMKPALKNGKIIWK